MSLRLLACGRHFGHFRRAVGSALLLALAATGVQAGALTVYSSADADVLKIYADEFQRAHPAIKVEWVRDSTGIIQSRLMTEKAGTRADVVFAHTAANLVAIGQAGLLAPYAPAGLDRLNGRFLEKREPPQWVGLYGWASTLCVNTAQAQKTGLPPPRLWTDLVQPAYKGKVVMPNPATSGTGLLMVNGWIQLWGEDKAWAYMDKLHQNIASYTSSGSRPCEMAAAGETVVGLSLPARGARLKAKGAAIDVLIAEEGTGWDMQAAAIMKTTDNLKDAKIFMDWAVSKDAMEAYGRNAEVTALKVRVQKMEHLPANIPEKMVKVDFEGIAREKDRILAEWQRRYESKAEPKK